jgi:Flp pilus assembly protein CpaB
MQSKTPLLMVTALVCGLGAAFGTWKLVSGAANNPADEAKVKVLVPVADVAPYYMFQDGQRFTEMEWPKSKLREDLTETITSFDQIKGKTSRHYKLKPNEPIYKNDICDNLENDVSERLRNGEVAHAVQVTAEHGGGGFVNVGDRVDVSATVQPTNGETSIRTFYVLENIEVLAVDNQAQKAVNTMATPPTRFLLRLTRAQSLVMKYFQDTSKIDYVKRKLGDPHVVGESIYFAHGKKTSAIPGYQDDQLEGTVTQNLPESRLPDPIDDNASRPRVDNKVEAIKPGDLTEEETRRLKHTATINVDGTVKKQETNAFYEQKFLKKKEPATSNKDEGKKEEAKKDDGKSPGQ